MSVTVVLPPRLRELVGGSKELPIQGRPATVAELFEALREQAPAVYDRLLTERHELRPHLNVFVGQEDIRWSGGVGTPLGEGSQVLFLTAVSGG
jgi:molybdopterin converting factor small subunit